MKINALVLFTLACGVLYGQTKEPEKFKTSEEAGWTSAAPAWKSLATWTPESLYTFPLDGCIKTKIMEHPDTMAFDQSESKHGVTFQHNGILDTMGPIYLDRSRKVLYIENTCGMDLSLVTISMKYFDSKHIRIVSGQVDSNHLTIFDVADKEKSRAYFRLIDGATEAAVGKIEGRK